MVRVLIQLNRKEEAINAIDLLLHTEPKNESYLMQRGTLYC